MCVKSLKSDDFPLATHINSDYLHFSSFLGIIATDMDSEDLTKVLIAVVKIGALYVLSVFSEIIMYYFFHRKNNQRNVSIY